MKQESIIRFLGNEQANPDYYDGQLPHLPGVHNIEVMRCDRNQKGSCLEWTYNHAPMLACFQDTLLLSYLSNPHSEHVAPGRTLICFAKQDLQFSEPIVLFPEYPIPDGVFSYQGEPLPPGSWAVMHQRSGFFEAPNGKMLALGNYGISPDGNVVPFGELSIGRVVREIHQDLSLGPVYFIRYNVNTPWNEENTHFPFYLHSQDREFVEACEALLSDPLATQQWAEEQGDEDPLITLKARDCGPLNNKAFCYYQLESGEIIGLWKWMRCAVSKDGGKSWDPQQQTDGVWYAGAKIWGQRTADKRYALVYNPHAQNGRRWPLAVATSEDGRSFRNMRLVAGAPGPQRYAGSHKTPGFHYVRGIENRGGAALDQNLYVAYSLHKEDIWVARIPVPVADSEERCIHEHPGDSETLEKWTIVKPKGDWLRQEGTALFPDGCLIVQADDEHATRAERVFAQGTSVTVRFCFAVKGDGKCRVELLNEKGDSCVVVSLLPKQGHLLITHGRKTDEFAATIEPEHIHCLEISADARRQCFFARLDGAALGKNRVYQGQTHMDASFYFAKPARWIASLAFAFGDERRLCAAQTPVLEERMAEGKTTLYLQEMTIISEMD